MDDTRSPRRGVMVAAVAALLAAIPLPDGRHILPTAIAREAGPGALPGISGEDDRRILDTVAWPWSAVGRVNVGGRSHCTGTLVGPRHVLTAAHCLLHPRTGLVLPHTIHFVAGYRRGAHLFHSVAVEVTCGGGDACLDTGEGRGIAWPADEDWALIVLRETPDIRPVPLGDPGGAPVPVTLAGYARDRPHLMMAHENCTLEPLGEGALVAHDCDATFGDSGSPLISVAGADSRLLAQNVGFRPEGGRLAGIAISSRAFAAALRELADR